MRGTSSIDSQRHPDVAGAALTLSSDWTGARKETTTVPRARARTRLDVKRVDR